jgi:Swi5-dependent recombination DNA repair protein 1
MSLPPSKKRRIDTQNILLKPFKSPLQSRLPNKSQEVTQEIKDECPKGSAPTLEPVHLLSSPSKNLASPVSSTGYTPRSIVKSNLPQMNNELSALQRQYTSTADQLKTLKTELDQVKQARKIEESSRDSELINLTKLWKSASQQAAEEVYAIVRDRVNAMGGLKVWKEREKEKQENAFFNWAVESDNGPHNNEDDSELESLDRPEDKDEDACDEQDEEEFSMEVMIRSLNIPPDVIGFDVQNQRWIT